MEYREFLAGLDPVIVGVNNGSFSLNREAFWAQMDKANRVISSKYVLAHVAKDYFDVEATFAAAIQPIDENGPVVPLLRIECSFYGHFHTKGTVEREYAQRFVDTEAWLIFWPFFRQFVADTTARMSIPPLVVPLALRAGEHSRPMRPRKQIAEPDDARKDARRGKRAQT